MLPANHGLEFNLGFQHIQHHERFADVGDEHLVFRNRQDIGGLPGDFRQVCICQPNTLHPDLGFPEQLYVTHNVIIPMKYLSAGFAGAAILA